MFFHVLKPAIRVTSNEECPIPHGDLWNFLNCRKYAKSKPNLLKIQNGRIGL